MANILSFQAPEKITTLLGQKAKLLRLDVNLSRKNLASRSGVPESTIKHFETTGQISLLSLLKLALVLNRLEDFATIFELKPATSLQDLRKPKRARGRA